MKKKNIRLLYLVSAILVGLLLAAIVATPYLDKSNSARNTRGRSDFSIRETGARTEAFVGSPLSAPERFDLEQFRSKPEEYLAKVEPSRVFQTAEASGPGSVYLMPVSRLRISVRASERVVVAVKGAPAAPVTFTALDGGTFAENRQSSITLLANAAGSVQATFVGGAARGDLVVLVGSPLAVGNQRFYIRVTDG